MVEYTVLLLDKDGCETANDLVHSMAAAKSRAKYFLSDGFAHQVESTHQVLGSHKVEIRDASGECLWDSFF